MLYDEPFICPATGHIQHRVTEPTVADAICPDHGVRLFRECPTCGSPWPMLTEGFSDEPSTGRKFCTGCGNLAVWSVGRTSFELSCHVHRRDPASPFWCSIRRSESRT